jgi:hypothetical protein
MQSLKDQLIQLIEAYSAAKSSGNTTLVQFAANSLSGFLGTIELVQIEGAGEAPAPEQAEE